jgi:hypothetical protein
MNLTVYRLLTTKHGGFVKVGDPLVVPKRSLIVGRFQAVPFPDDKLRAFLSLLSGDNGLGSAEVSGKDIHDTTTTSGTDSSSS